MRNSICLLFCFTSLFLSAQSSGNIRIEGIGTEGSGDLSVEMLSKFRQVGKTRGNSLNATGTPYLNNDFQRTQLYYDNSLQGEVYYRYNAYNQEIEIAPNTVTSNDLNALTKDKKIAINVAANKMSFKTFITANNKTINGYLISLIDSEKYDLYKRIYVIFSQGRPAANSFVKAVPNRLTYFTEYYYQQKGIDRIDYLPVSNRKFVKKFDGDVKSRMKGFLQNENLNVKNETDLKIIFEFLNK
jgi:hypothetical protein